MEKRKHKWYFYLLMALLCYVVWMVVGFFVGTMVKVHTASENNEGSSPEWVTEETAYGTERVLAVTDSEDALKVRIQLIREADSRIDLCDFNLKDDTTGKQVMAALADAADRGVKVNILLDGLHARFGGYTSKSLRALSRKENVEIRVYNPINWILPWTNNYRLQEKFLIIDNDLYLYGGRSNNDTFLGESALLNDMEVVVYETQPKLQGSLYNLRQNFNALWNCKEVHAKSFRLPSGSAEKVYSEFKSLYKDIGNTVPGSTKPVDWEAETLSTDYITLYAPKTDSLNRNTMFWDAMSEKILGADSALISTPYLVLDDKMEAEFLSATDGGTNVTMLTNVYATTYDLWGGTDFLKHREELLYGGLKLAQYYGSPAYSRRCILVDENTTLVGTMSMDMRSAYLNTVTMLDIEGYEFNQLVRTEEEARITKGILDTQIGGISVGTECKVVPISTRRKIAYHLIGLLDPLVRSVL